MRAVIQKVKQASVKVNDKSIGEIAKGYVIFVGFNHQDNQEIIDKVISKIIKLRIFEDQENKMNLDINTVNGEILSISQFTLYAQVRKGNRPSFTESANFDEARKLYDYFNQQLAKEVKLETGEFGADMDVELINHGPVTITIDSENL